jgi:hypothetical protein
MGRNNNQFGLIGDYNTGGFDFVKFLRKLPVESRIEAAFYALKKDRILSLSLGKE